MTPEKERAMQLAVEAGHILLENGAEITRVEETMRRISSHYGVENQDFFVLSNGIIATGRQYASAKFIPIRGTQLSRIVAVNQLSRDVSGGKRDGTQVSLDEVEERLKAIRASRGKPWWEITFGAAFGVSSFCLLFGGSMMDALSTLLCGILLGLFINFVCPHMSRIFSNMLGGMVGGLLCILAYQLSVFIAPQAPLHLPNMIIATIIALVPGVPFTNGIRDLANEDYIAGTTRLVDAFLVFLCIAVGVMLALIFYGALSGGLVDLGAPAVDAFTAAWYIQLPAAFIGTIGFSALFGAPRRYYLTSALAAMLGWGMYILVNRCTPFSVVGASFLAALVVAGSSHILSGLKRCPVTVFLICGIIPLVPGGGIFWTAYHLVANNLRLAATQGFVAIKITVAIAGGIIVASAIGALYRRRNKRRLAILNNK